MIKYYINQDGEALIVLDHDTKVAERFSLLYSEDSVKTGSFNCRKKGLKVIKCKINWHTIKNIEKMKADGRGSQEIAEVLHIPLQSINKYWNK
jgi:hypothetical protein